MKRKQRQNLKKQSATLEIEKAIYQRISRFIHFLQFNLLFIEWLACLCAELKTANLQQP